MSHQFSKKKQLVESIKQTMSKPTPVVSKNTNKTAQPSSYSSYLNTAIDYTKDHSVTPYLEPQNQFIYNLDSDSPEGQNQQNLNDQQLYDDEIMNEIEMQIYSETKKQQQQNNHQNDNQIYQQEEDISYQEPKQKVTKNLPPLTTRQRQKRKVNLKYNNLYQDNNYEEQDYQPQNGSYHGKTQKKWTQDYDQDYQEAKIQEDDQQQLANKIKKQFAKPVNEPQPVKKLITSPSIQQSKKFINFTINIKLLDNKLKINKVLKCLTDGKVIRRQDAKYLVQIDNERKDQKVVGNTQLIHFYKEQLIEYYQNLHFS